MYVGSMQQACGEIKRRGEGGVIFRFFLCLFMGEPGLYTPDMYVCAHGWC